MPSLQPDKLLQMRWQRHISGYSLIELLIALSISAIVLAPLPAMLSNALSAASVLQKDYDLHRRSRFAMERISQTISKTAHKDLAPNSGTTASGNWFGPIGYSLSGNQLVETDASSSASRVIAEDVAAFSITANRSTGREVITVVLTIGDSAGTVTRSGAFELGAAL